MAKFIFMFIIIIFIIIWQFGFYPALAPEYFYFFNLPLFFIALVAFFGTWEIIIFSTVVLGLFLDLYSTLFLGFYTGIFIISVLVIKFFLANFFQHKNILSLFVADIVPLIVFQLVYLIYYFFSPLIGSFSRQYLSTFFVGAFVHSLLILLLIILPNPLKHKLRNQNIS